MFKRFRFRRKEAKTSQSPLSPDFANATNRGPDPDTNRHANVGYIVDVKKLPKLHRAVWKGKQNKVKKLLVKDRRKFLAVDRHERTALHYAVCKQNLHIVDLLLNSDGVTALLMQDDEGNNPLHKSIECDWFEVTVRLTELPFSKEAVVMCNHRGKTPLHLAAQLNNVNCGNTLLDAGAYIDAKDNDGHCPLALATLNRGMEFIELMKKKEAIVNAPNEKGETPLTHAVRANDLDIVKQLLAFSGINPSLPDNAGMSPTEYAELMNNTEIYERNLTELPELVYSDSESDTLFTQDDFETFVTTVKAERPTRELASNNKMPDLDDLEIPAIETSEHYENMKDLPSSIKVEDDTCIMEVDKEPASLVTEDTQDPMKDKSAGGNKGAIISAPIITDSAITLVTNYNDSMSPSLSGVVANTKGVTPTSEAMPPISAMPSSSATPLSSVTPQSGATPTNSGSLNRRGMRQCTVAWLSSDSSDEDSSMDTACSTSNRMSPDAKLPHRIKRSPPIEGADCSPCTDDSPCTDNSPVHRSSMNSELSNQQDIVIHVHVRPKRKLEKERDERCKMTAILESAETAQKALENKVKTERSARQELVISIRENLVSSIEEIKKLRKELQSSADTNLQLQDSVQSMQHNYDVQNRSKDQVGEIIDGMSQDATTELEETRTIVRKYQQVVQEGKETLKDTLNQSDEATDEQMIQLQRDSFGKVSQSEMETNKRERDWLQTNLNALEEMSSALKSTYENYVAYMKEANKQIWKVEQEQNIQTNMYHHLSRRTRLRARRLNRQLSKQTRPRTRD